MASSGLFSAACPGQTRLQLEKEWQERGRSLDRLGMTKFEKGDTNLGDSGRGTGGFRPRQRNWLDTPAAIT